MKVSLIEGALLLSRRSLFCLVLPRIPQRNGIGVQAAS